MHSPDVCANAPSTSTAAHACSKSVSSICSAAQLASESLSVQTCSSAATSSAASNAQSLSKKRARNSLSVLGSIPKDISALIRSHSSSRRQHSQPHQHTDTHASAGEMHHDDRSRKSKSENRASIFIYRFITRSLTRSRSRSRSRNGRDTPPPIDPDEPIPDLPPPHNINGRIQVDTMGQSTPSKPTSRIPSRPLSSTTTATNTTITPATPRARKRPPSGIPIPEAAKFSESPGSPMRPTTPKASAARKKMHTLFGIPLSSPKKSSFSSSRQSSRRPSMDVPPPPLLEHEDDFEDNDPTPKALKSYAPHPYARPESPSPDPRPKLTQNPSTSSTTTSSASGSSRLQRFFTGHKTPPPPSTDAVSGPMRRPSGSSHHRRNSASNSVRNNSPTIPSPDTPPSKSNVPGTMAPPPNPPPRIVHIPPTPLRPERPGTAPPMKASSSLGHSSRKGSVDSGRGVGRGDGLGGMNGHARMKMTQTHGSTHRSTKHGSFDFERPGWSAAAGAIQRTGSGGTTTSGAGTSFGGWGRGQDGLVSGIRDSAMGPGMAGVGTLQRDVSLKRGKEREEMMIRAREEERRRRRAEAQGAKEKIGERDLGTLPENSPLPRALSPQEIRAATSTSTARSSSWGKKRGDLFGSGGKTKITSLGLSHGPFAFEPAVPSPTRSTGSMGTGTGLDAPLSVSWAGEKGRDNPRVKGELERERERMKGREKERRSQSYHRGDRAPVPVPSASIGHRSGAKGRSLDLGLGLSWAPTTVREDALLLTSGYFGRSASGSSSLGGRSVGGRSVSGSTNGHATIEEERSILGNQVAGVFKNALDDAGYSAFRQYVHRFDAHDIPFEGPAGIVARVERLLMTAPDLSEEGKQQLLDSFVRVVLQHA
ncbi:hypothetical protein D9615_000585 [Tricholomella constricta]|uniref:Uncharacterized protein n=1 Tax=Tricholomella constricta TaxID=117010 RepID=A0A8H5HRE5_9AGAR|nr:hypothetical protein D9615_000585 [Tricholomella constricta]